VAETLRQSEARFRLALQNSPITVFQLDTDLRYTWVFNPPYGSSGEDYIGKRDEELLPAENAAELMAFKRQVLDSNRPLRHSFILPIGDITYYFDIAAEPLHDEAGNVVGLTMAATDLTERKQIEDERDAENARLRAVLEQMPSGVVIVQAPEGQVILVNDQTAEIMGRPFVPAEGIDSYMGIRALHTDGTPYMPEEWPLTRATTTGEVVTEEEMYLERADGVRLVLSVSASPIRDNSGEIVAGVVVFSDVTAQATAEAQLREMNESLERRVIERTRALRETNRQLQAARDLFYVLFHASPVPTMIIRLADGYFLDANEELLRYLNIERDALVGHEAPDLPLWERPEDRRRFLEGVARLGAVHDFKTHIARPPGEVRQALISATRIEIAGEMCAIGSVLDVTNLAQAEQRVRVLASDLILAEQRERRRISQLLHDNLQQMLVAQRIQLGLLADQVSPPLRGEVEALASLSEEAVELTRSLSSELAGPVADSEFILDGLRWLAALMSERYRLEVTLDVQDGTRIPRRDVRLLLLRLVRELLFNVVKHAGVRRAMVTAGMEGQELHVCVIDKGVGFDAAGWQRPRRHGLWLWNAQERQGRLDGWL